MEKKILEELQEKKAFAEGVGAAIADKRGISVSGIRYEVYKSPKGGYLQEYLVMVYDGGAIAARNCNCNSNSANFREIAMMINGGYYGEVKQYREIAEKWNKVL